MTITETLNDAERTLVQHGVPDARFDAEVLLAQVVRQNRAWLFTHGSDALDTKRDKLFREFIERRARREPLQYILGTQEFRGLDFLVTPSVLIPRPETELVVETAVAHCREAAPQATIIDLCTGSGCIAVSLAKALGKARIFATDRSPEALEVARKNARRHQVSERIRFFEGDLFGPLGELNLQSSIDVITANPPYIPSGDYQGLQPEVRDYEPQLALLAGPKGTEIARRIIGDAVRYLTKDGLLIMEMGQGQRSELKQAGIENVDYSAVTILKDLAGIDRVLMAKKR